MFGCLPIKREGAQQCGQIFFPNKPRAGKKIFLGQIRAANCNLRLIGEETIIHHIIPKKNPFVWQTKLSKVVLMRRASDQTG